MSGVASTPTGAGRFGGDRLRARVPTARLLAAGATLSAMAMAVVLLSQHMAVALAGLALVGLGLSNVIPILFVAASRVSGAPRCAAGAVQAPDMLHPMASAPPAHRASSAVQAAAWMVGALLSFLAMAIAGRELAQLGLSTFQILFFRSVVGLVVIGLVVLRTGPALLRTRRLGEHCWRNVAHFGGQFGWFFAIALMPLAEVFAIEFTIPIWTALLAAMFLGERLTRPRVIALAFGLAGVLLVLRPGLSIVQPAALAALGGAFAYAASHLMTKRLAATEAPLAILFYMTVVQLPLGLAGALPQWQPATADQAPWLALVGVTALTAHYCLTRALKLAEVGAVLPIDFLRLPLVALIGWAFYGEAVGLMAVAGALLIVAGNVINLRAAPAR